jgi:aldehyde:ferredoxin oxidoreductase
MKEERLYGYAGKLVRVKLDKKEAKTEKIEPKEIRKFIGGVGYAAKILYDELPRGIDPLDPRNKIVFATGPLTGTRAP